MYLKYLNNILICYNLVTVRPMARAAVVFILFKKKKNSLKYIDNNITFKEHHFSNNNYIIPNMNNFKC